MFLQDHSIVVGIHLLHFLTKRGAGGGGGGGGGGELPPLPLFLDEMTQLP